MGVDQTDGAASEVSMGKKNAGERCVRVDTEDGVEQSLSKPR